jgi:aminopeptidase N
VAPRAPGKAGDGHGPARPRRSPSRGGRRLIATLLTLLLLASTRGPADPYPRNADLDAFGYLFRITLSDSTDELLGEATIDFRFLASGRTRIPLDLIGVGEGGRGMRVEGVEAASGPLSYRHAGDRLDITLPAAARSGERVRLTVRYRGVPASGLRIGPNKYGERTFFSDNWPHRARHWLPTVDHPSDKATVEFVVTAPAHYQVISNGLLREETDLGGGLRRTRWKHRVPIATWLFTLGVGRMAVEHAEIVEGIPIQAWVYPQDRQQGFLDFGGPTRKALDFFRSQIGPYPYEKLANIQSPALGGGMEAASAISYGEKEIGGARIRGIIVHEIAHQWWGNAVTERDWDDVWLSEGFATYFTLLFTEHDEGRDRFLAGLRQSRATVLDFDRKNPGYRVVHDNLSDMARVTSVQTYQKGAWILHMLRGVVGTEVFWRAIREYYRRYRDGNASTDDFRRIVEEASGRDLERFFRQWLHRSGWPVLEGGWRYDPAAKRVEVELRQSQEGEAFVFPLEIGIAFGSDSSRIERVEIGGQPARVGFPAETEPSAVTLDPNLWVLMESRFGKR